MLLAARSALDFEGVDPDGDRHRHLAGAATDSRVRESRQRLKKFLDVERRRGSGDLKAE
jgi:hypothetical protein